MSATAPHEFRWDAERSVMAPRRPHLADRLYVDHEWYLLESVEERSSARHRAFFAQLREAHMNLPDDLAERYPTTEKLRKEALIRTGWCDTQTSVWRSHAEAEKVVAFMRPSEDEIVEARGCVVTRYTARSQSVRAMSREDFNASAEAVLGWVSGLLGVTPRELEHNAGAAA